MTDVATASGRQPNGSLNASERRSIATALTRMLSDQVRRRIPQAVFLFLAPPSPADLVSRLGSRQTESPEEVARRIRDAKFELAQLPYYDYCVINHDRDLDGTVSDVACVISAERLRISRQPIDLT